jgi:hypothetical protein
MDRVELVYLAREARPDLHKYRLLINTICTPDTTRSVLEAAVPALKGMNVINRPEQLLLHRRDRSATLLQNIEGLIVPLTRAQSAKRNSDVGELPRILRESGTNDGRSMVLAETREHVDVFLAGNIGKDIYSIPFVDYRSEDGFYRKARVRMIDGMPFPIHLYTGRNWCVHSGDAKQAFEEEPYLVEQETEFLSSPLSDKLQSVLREIHQRIGVEVYGIDLGLHPNGDFVFFEANPAMTLMTEWQLKRPSARAAAERMFAAYRRLITARAS